MTALLQNSPAAEIQSGSASPNEPIAIIGMACRLPGADDPDMLWQMVLERREGVAEYPGGRTAELDAFYRRVGLPDGPSSNRGGFLDGIDRFDAGFFEISPREAEWLDPQQRLLLESAWEALEDAGIPQEGLAHGKTGVFVGVWNNEYERHAASNSAVADFFLVTGGPLYGASSRIAYQFDLRGPDVSANAACASSLVAVHLAVRALRAGDCAVALAGGVNALVRHEFNQALSRSKMLSPDGRCKFGDASADGFVRSDGVGMLVLKRLSDAERDGDRVLGLIRGTAICNDGRGSGLLVTPSAAGQRQAMLGALADAGVAAETVDLVEAHGTGTRAGDPIEVSAIASVFGRRAGSGVPCRVASVKSNIGHTESAAGVASIIRTVQAMRHRRFPATLHVHTPNPDIDWKTNGLALETEGAEWIAADGAPLRAGVNGLGLTGTNAHVILESAPTAKLIETEPPAAFLLVLSAASGAALKERAAGIVGTLAALDEQTSALHDLCYTAAVRRTHLPHRLAVSGVNAADLRAQLEQWLRNPDASTVSGGTAYDKKRRTVFVFPGQGSQWVGMGRELLVANGAFRQKMQEVDAAILEEAGWSVLAQLSDTSLEDRLSKIDVVQPTLFAVEVALAALWISWGVVSDSVVGHSMGEVAAAYVAGILSLEDAVKIICRRSKLLLRVAGNGTMAVVDLTRAEAEQRIAGLEDRVSVAVCNSPRSTVLAGDPATLKGIVDELEREDVFCRWVKVDVASHSPQMDPLRDDLASALAGIKPNAALVPMQSTVAFSTTTGEQMVPAYWVANLREPVMFADAIGRLIEQGCDTFLEMSPHPLLLPFVQQTGDQEATGSTSSLIAVGSLRREEPELATLFGALAKLFVAGASIDWSAVYPAGNLVKLPAYPWQRERFWMASSNAGRGASFSGGHALIGEAQQTGAGDWIWSARIDGDQHPWLRDHVVGGAVLLPGSSYIEIAGAVSGTIFEGAPAVIEDLALLQAAVLPEQRGPEPGALQLQVIATRESQDVYTLKFFCRDTDAAEWTLTASAQLRKQGHASDSLKSDLSEWRDAEFSDHATGGAQHSRRMAGLGYSFGPTFCVIDWLSLESTVALAQIRTSDIRQESYLLHPALLDAALQLAGRLFLERSEHSQTMLPVACARAEWFAPVVAGGALYAKATAPLDKLLGEIEVYGSDGTLVLRMSGFAFAPLQQETSESDEALLFETAWEPLRLAQTNKLAQTDRQGAATTATWLITGGQIESCNHLVGALQRAGINAMGIEPQQLLSPEVFATGVPREIVWFAPTVGAGGKSDLADVLDMMHQASQFVALLDSAPDIELGASEAGLAQTRLCVVTRGTQPVQGEPVEDVMGAGLWGFVASAQNEYPQLQTMCIDLPTQALEAEADLLAAALLRGGDEARIALRPAGSFIPRLIQSESPAFHGAFVPASELRSSPAAVVEGFDLGQTMPGSIESLQLLSCWIEPPGEDEVQIEIRAAGLNFKDVLRVMALAGITSSTQLGGECSGVVLRVGSAVRGFAPGDEVLAMSPSLKKKGMLASHVNVPELLVAKKPPTMSFAEAAGIPCVFFTAWHSLVKLARLQAGERVLIHAATGGVGLAAIQVAKWIGAEIFATAGSEEKREYLRGLGIVHIMNSRTLDFRQEILDATGGQGVDVVLNSLTGSAIAAGLNALAPYGRFIEIGRRDILEDTRIGLKPFHKNLSLFSVDLSQTVEDRRPFAGAVLAEIMEQMRLGHLTPVRTELFPVSAAAEAFQKIAQAAHIGKIALDMSDPNAMVRRDKSKLDPSATYLITGGTGGLGLATAATLVDHGARHLVLTARKAPSESAQQAIGQLEAAGASILFRQMDIGVPGEVSVLFDEIVSTQRRLAGIVHTAGVLDDAVVARLTPANFASVTGGKVGGAVAIDACLDRFDLDFLVYYSSAAGVLGNPGQANYAAANTMLDALAHNQRARGIPTISIDWGSWGEVGLAAASEDRGTRLATQGLRPMTRETGTSLLMKALTNEPVQISAMRFDPTAWCATHPAAARSHLFDHLLQRSDLSSSKDDFAEMLLRLSNDERRSKLLEWLRDQVAAVLRLEAERVPDDKPLRTLGLDSLMALELRNRLERTLPVKLSATFVWNYPTLAAIVGYIDGRLDLAIQNQPKPSDGSVPIAPVPIALTPIAPAVTLSQAVDHSLTEELSAADLLEAELAGAEPSSRGHGR